VQAIDSVLGEKTLKFKFMLFIIQILINMATEKPKRKIVF